MKLTRIDSSKLATAVSNAQKKLTEALGELEPYMVLLNDEERAEMLRPKKSFMEAGRQMAQLLGLHSEIAKSSGVEVAALKEDLTNVETIEPLVLFLERLSQMVSDSKLAWLAESYEQVLMSYRFAKVQATLNPKIAQDLEPMQQYFGKGKREPTKEPKA